MNIAKMMKQAQDMQNRMQKAQEEISKMEFESTSGGGAVTAKVNGDGRLLTLKISKEAAASGDSEMLEDLVLSAVNSALDTSKQTAQQKLSGITAGLNIPGLGGL